MQLYIKNEREKSVIDFEKDSFKRYMYNNSDTDILTLRPCQALKS